MRESQMKEWGGKYPPKALKCSGLNPEPIQKIEQNQIKNLNSPGYHYRTDEKKQIFPNCIDQLVASVISWQCRRENHDASPYPMLRIS
tara:strand:+ start:455 stop:718 length:264 start_codon:yes stop_codon:yes gene_type:complete